MSSGLKKTVHEIVDSQAVQSPITKKVLGHLETLLGTVSIDKEQLSKKIEEVLSRSARGSNPFYKAINTIVGIFGMRLVSNDNGVNIKVTANREDQILTINRQKAKEVISAITVIIDDAQKDSERFARERRQLDEVVLNANRSTERIRQELDSLQRECNQKDKRTLQAVQRILAQQPELVPAGEEEQNALLLYFEDLGLTWSWDSDSSPNDFTTYTVSDSATVGVRLPCLYRDGETVLKGLKYQYENPSAKDAD